MKRYRYLLHFIVTVFVLACTSCQKDTPLPYDGLTGITFQSVSMFNDRVTATPTYPLESEQDTNFVREAFFAYDPVDTFRIFTIPVAALGYTTDFDRPVSFEVDSTTTLAADKYEIAQEFCNIGAGKTVGVLNIKVDRPDLSVKFCKLVVKLVPNQYFSYVNGDGRYFTLNLYNVNAKPRYWDYPTVNGLTCVEFFGLYSNNKFQFIHDTLTKIEEYANLAKIESFKSAVYNNTDAIQRTLQNAYDAYKEAGNDPILDENTGKEIVFGY